MRARPNPLSIPRNHEGAGLVHRGMSLSFRGVSDEAGSCTLVLLLGISLPGCRMGNEPEEAGPEQVLQETIEEDREAVADLVENFGRQLKAVSLLAPPQGEHGGALR